MNLKKTLLTNLKYIAFGVVIAVSMSYAYAAWGTPAGTYADPSGTPPASNTDTPLNVSSIDQVKSIGSCIAGNCGGLSITGAFLASKNAEFDGSLFIHGIAGAGTNGVFPASSTVRFGGVDSVGISHPTSVTASGMLATSAKFQSNTLVNSDGTKTLCSDVDGNVTFCDVVDMCTNIPGAQSAVPSGDIQNADGTCTKAPKRFYSAISYKQYDSYPDTIVGGIVNGQFTMHVPDTVINGVIQGRIPLVAQIGLYNGPVSCQALNGCSEWVHNEIPGVVPTSFTSDGSRLMTVAEDGTYHIKVTASGQIGIKGKFSNDNQTIGSDFYMKVNNQWIRMYDNFAPNTGNHEEYPVTGKTLFDFAKVFPSTADSNGQGGKGDQYQYVPYSIHFDETFPLHRGDTVDIYALIYGYSRRSDLFNSSLNNFYYSFDEGGTVFDITEIPD